MASVCELLAGLIGYAIKTFPVYSLMSNSTGKSEHPGTSSVEILTFMYLRLELISVVKHDYVSIRESFKGFSELSEGRSKLVQMPNFNKPGGRTQYYPRPCAGPGGMEKRII